MAEPAKAEKAIAPLAIKRPKTLSIGSLQLAEHKRNLWVGETGSETTIDEMLSPDFWIHDARRLKPRDEIEVWADSGDWLEVFVVRSVHLPEVGKAVVRVMRKDDLPRSDDKPKEAKPIDGYSVKWRGPHSKFAVMRDSVNEPVKDKFEVREEAEAWLKDFLKKQAA